MSKDIRIRKGLDIKLAGAAEKTIKDAPFSSEFGLVPDDLHGVVPRLIKREGEHLRAGEPVYQAKQDPRIFIASPVSGTIKEVRRGEKRKILSVIITPDSHQDPVTYDTTGWLNASEEAFKKLLCDAGFWPFIKQRPYDVVANPDTTPKAIFISAYNSGPIAADADMLVAGKEQYLQEGINGLKKLTPGQVHVTVARNNTSSPFRNLQNLTIHNASGPHPVGNVSTHIAQVDPMNKGQHVWVVKPEHVAVLGEFLATGVLSAERVIAVNGPMVKNPAYVKTRLGSKISDITKVFELQNIPSRIIQGTPISGDTVQPDGHLGFYTNQLAILEEGNDYDFFGWNKPQPNKFSVLRANTFSFLTPGKKYNLTTNTNGEERAFVMNGMYQDIFPLDVYPVQLMKSCLYKDIDEMEQLGIYEVAPEDFALTEFICVSKLPHQQIIRAGLDEMIREIG